MGNRKIMIDTLTALADITTYAEEDQMMLKLPVPDDDNSGRAGVVGVSKHVWTKQACEIEITSSGDLYDANSIYGGKFKFKIDNALVDHNGSAIQDVTASYLGRDPYYDGRLVRSWGYASGNKGQPKCHRIRHWDDESTYQRIGLGVITTSRYVYVTSLISGPPFNGQPSYYWDSNRSTIDVDSDTGVSTTGTVLNSDFVELDDGKIVLMATFVTGGAAYVAVWHSYDCGETWEYIRKDIDSGVQAEDALVSMVKIGSRIVATFCEDAIGGHIFYTYSDDGGYTWALDGNLQCEDTGYVCGSVLHNILDTYVGDDGLIYILYAGDPGDGDRLYIGSSADGINWETAEIVIIGGFYSASFLQTHTGGWVIYAVDDTLSIRQYIRDSADPMGLFDTSEYVTPDFDNGGSAFINKIHCRGFNNNGFIDIFMNYEDSSGSPYTGRGIFRVGQWSGLQIDEDYDHVWAAVAYPSSSDDAPDSAVFSKSAAGASHSVLLTSEECGYLTVKDTNSLTGSHYVRYSKTLSTVYTNGLLAKFAFKRVSGVSSLIISGDDGSNNQFGAQIEFGLSSSDRIYVYDIVDDSRSYVTLTNWDVDDWGEYVVIVNGSNLKMYRAPLEQYNEVFPYELVLDVDLTTTTGTTSNVFRWGAIASTDGISYGVTEGRWMYMMLNTSPSSDIKSWDIDADQSGARCVDVNPIGLYQGIGCKFEGNWVVGGDIWDLDVGAQYACENILVPSPSIRWQEVENYSVSPERIIEWEAPSGSVFEVEAVALFGKNFMNFRLQGYNEKTPGYENIIYVSESSVNHFGFYRQLEVYGSSDTYVNRNVVRVARIDTGPIQSGAGGGRMIPDQFASTLGRCWYVYVNDGPLDGYIYKILGNDEEHLILDADVEDAGLTGGVPMFVFSDRIFYDMGELKKYTKLKLTIASAYTAPTEKQLRLGSVLAGRLYDGLSRGDWGFTFETVRGTNIITAPSGLQHVNEVSQSRRKVTLTYSGQEDMGMGVTTIHELLDRTKWGVHPIVFVDDDSSISDIERMGLGSSFYGTHDEPMLCRVVSDIGQSHQAYKIADNPMYKYYYSSGATLEAMYYSPVRNILDTSAIVFEEII